MKCSELLPTLRVNLLFLLFLLIPSLSLGAEVFLKDRSQVSGQEVTLGDVAQIKGTHAE